MEVKKKQEELVKKLKIEEVTTSKANWFRLGDSNTIFSSLATKIRKVRNSTLTLINVRVG